MNADRCGLPSSYAFQLVDNRGQRYPFRAAGPIQESTAQGHLGATLHDDSVEGAFAISVGADTRFVVLQIRPVADRGCTAVDFRWDFQAAGPRPSAAGAIGSGPAASGASAPPVIRS